MIFNWTTELINEALTGLSEKQIAALDLMQSLPPNSKPGAARLQRYGLTADQYAILVESARAHMKHYCAIRGVRHVSDLEFEEPGVSIDGRIQKSLKRSSSNNV